MRVRLVPRAALVLAGALALGGGALVLGLGTGRSPLGAAPVSAPSLPAATGSARAVVPPLTPTPDPETKDMPPGCTRNLVREIVTEFLGAFNRGDQAALAGFFGPGFSWYSVDSRPVAPFFVTYDRAELPAYFAARHAQAERLELLELKVTGRSGPTGRAAGFGYALRRTADDLPGSRRAEGKGSLFCSDRTIGVWSMGTY